MREGVEGRRGVYGGGGEEQVGVGGALRGGELRSVGGLVDETKLLLGVFLDGGSAHGVAGRVLIVHRGEGER